jgi:protein-S-isoprenylcysteine O-methyltransferase Ste14
MPRLFSALIPILWGLWLLYWAVAATGAKPTQRSESIGSRLSHVLPIIVGGVLMGVPHLLGGVLEARLVPPTRPWLWSGAALVAFGLGLSVLARVWLGGNWSGTVTIKADHELIRGGPYAYVRHPIYSGLLLALLGTALTLGTERALIGVAVIAVALIRKLSLEERFMREQFGDAHARYRAEVPALIPFVF